MRKNNSFHRATLGLGILAMSVPVTALAEDNLWQALTGGKVDFYLRPRFEFVDDDQPQIINKQLTNLPLKDAYAYTLRTALGYSTGLFYGFGGYVQLEDVRAVDDDLYNNGGENRVTDRAVVVDPEGTELQQANLRFQGIPKTTLWLGRQEIEHRQAPMHRYVGNILWRQNWQSFDALRVVSDYLPATKVDYAYIWNVNRIFGEDNPLPDRSDFSIDGHLINLLYTGFQYGSIEPYAYLLDFEGGTAEINQVTSAPIFSSTATYGARFQGSYDLLTYPIKVLYTGEFAHQTDYGESPADISVNYYLGELGGTYTFGGLVESITVKGSYEVLEGDGKDPKTGIARAFQTPLGTNHAFQGWADRFLITPADGIEDLFATLSAKIWGAQLMLQYHDFSANDADYDYGTEWDVVLSKTFLEHYTVGVKYADYDADEDPQNLARNAGGGQAFDLSKFWAWVEVKF